MYKKNKEMNFDLSGERYQQVDENAMDLLKRMLVANPAERIKAK